MGRTCELISVPRGFEFSTQLVISANDVLLLEIDAGGTQFAAGPVTKDAFATLIDGDQWMIYRNVLTGVLHWDFVSDTISSIVRYLTSCSGIQSVLGRFISFPVIDAQYVLSSMSSACRLTTHRRATGSININVTEINQLGEEWGSSTLTEVSASLSTNSSSANVGSIAGNRMFFDNDYMVRLVGSSYGSHV